MNPLNPLYIAVAWVMTHIHSGLSLIMPSTSGEAWFLTIVVLVVVMRLILVPLFVKQMHAMRKMSALTPQLQELRKKYKGDKQTLNEETMRLYKEAGVNPLGGCLPLLAQMPLFFALFSVLRAIAGWHAGLPSPYDMPISVVKSAQNANILGAHISDKVLFTGTMHVPLARQDRDPLRGRDQRHHHVHDGAAEHQARHDPADDARQPDGVLAEVHGVHRAVLRPVRLVLGVRPGPVLGDDQRVDARPAVGPVQALPADPGHGDRWHHVVAGCVDQAGHLGGTGVWQQQQGGSQASGAQVGCGRREAAHSGQARAREIYGGQACRGQACSGRGGPGFRSEARDECETGGGCEARVQACYRHKARGGHETCRSGQTGCREVCSGEVLRLIRPAAEQEASR